MDTVFPFQSAVEVKERTACSMRPVSVTTRTAFR